MTFANFRRVPAHDGKVYITADCVEAGREVYAFVPASCRDWKEVATAKMTAFVEAATVKAA